MPSISSLVLSSFPLPPQLQVAVCCGGVFVMSGQDSLALRSCPSHLRNCAIRSTTCRSARLSWNSTVSAIQTSLQERCRPPPTYLQQRSGPREFHDGLPFPELFGVAARRNVAGGVLQSYLVEWCLFVAGRHRRTEPGGCSSWTLPSRRCPERQLVDGVPNFTRVRGVALDVPALQRTTRTVSWDLRSAAR